ncbi:MAG TPA: cupredoxin domain-containing protein [Burkholderiales bacterium]|nr:cupredoxin domain-containing protein [Burkholderiales bacterium]
MKTALALLAMIPSLAFAQGPQEPVAVQLVEDRFVPDRLVFRHDVEYRLELRNDGKEMHEFTAPEFLKAVEVRNPEVLERAAPEVLLQPGERKELRFVARQPGRYPLTCADHDWDGMVGEIVVE